MKKEMVGDVPGNVLGMLADLAHKLQHGVITPGELAMFLKGENPFLSQSEIVADWGVFYLDKFGFNPDFLHLKIPEKRHGFDRLIVVAEGLTIQRVFGECAREFNCCNYVKNWIGKNLDEVVLTDDRDTKNGSYAIWVRDRIEADEELKNKSANDLKRAGIPGITLMERLLLEFKYFKETGKHLDNKNTTLCVGSLILGEGDNYVPKVRWGSSISELVVDWTIAENRFYKLRSRQVVS